MNFKERYDNIIDFIEENIKLSKSEIIKMIVNKFAMGNRLMLMNAFQFIADISMSEYIKRLTIKSQYSKQKKTKNIRRP